MLTRFRKERRRSLREGLDLPVRFRIYLPSSPDSSSPLLPGQLDNYSSQGIALLANAIHSDRLHIFHPMPTTSEQCLLEIRIPRQGEELTVHGKVIWYDRNTEENPFLFRVGIELLDHAKALRKQIETTIRDHVSQLDALM
jgi:hypothetical protein